MSTEKRFFHCQEDLISEHETRPVVAHLHLRRKRQLNHEAIYVCILQPLGIFFAQTLGWEYLIGHAFLVCLIS